jgi:toxin-antitoxin system PIN domain toxin
VKVIDGNILLYAVNDAAQHHVACRQWLQAALSGEEELGFNWIAIGSFLRISTNPRAFSKPLKPADAISQMQHWLDAPLVCVVEPPEGYWELLKQLLLGLGTAGDLTTDAQLAAMAILHNATLVSTDKDFSRFPGLKWENPLATL